MTAQEKTMDLEEQRERLLAAVDPKVSEALARFNLARGYAPAPVVVHAFGTRTSTSTNS